MESQTRGGHGSSEAMHRGQHGNVDSLFVTFVVWVKPITRLEREPNLSQLGGT